MKVILAIPPAGHLFFPVPRVCSRQCLGLSVARIESEDAAGSFLRFPGQGKGEVVTKS